MQTKKTKRLNREWHPWWEWECWRAGFFSPLPPEGVTPDEAKDMYREFLSDLQWFELAIKKVLYAWPVSCNQFLTNRATNRVAWLGQAAMCIETGVPACFRGGYKLLSKEQQVAADALAAEYLARWEEYKCIVQMNG